ncbi:hypothetical protein [Pimelobacter sp. 30-1]|uniref:hypothetical protein n=1 Tax=Pimelobacter sp. 30-1 TaxID=2004991 RepID=UPI001C058E82|nr:hypothetical protein [Pimelobacter sp. 30-1]MBU2698431.1 hypothetical protein [Pimelobacter sp. 30-1]
MPELEDRAPTAHERLLVVRTLADARTRGDLDEDDQLERTDMAVRVPTLVELAALVEGLPGAPALPAVPPPDPNRRRFVLGALGLLAVGATGGMLWARRDDPPPTSAPGPAPAPAPRPTRTPPSTTPPTTPATPEPAPDLYTVAGLTLLLREYRELTGTWRAYVLAVSEPHQASATAPHGPLGKRRERWWNWNAQDRWNTIFDPHAVTDPTDRAVDLRRFDLAAAVAHVARARRTLQVEKPTSVYLALGHEPDVGAIVEIVVGNAYGERGRLVTDAAGRVLAREPFVRS